MKNKDYSKWLKLILVIIGFILSVLKWVNIIPNASISEIWQVIGFAYAISLGTMDLNICRDSWTGNKPEEK